MLFFAFLPRNTHIFLTCGLSMVNGSSFETQQLRMCNNYWYDGLAGTYVHAFPYITPCANSIPPGGCINNVTFVTKVNSCCGELKYTNFSEIGPELPLLLINAVKFHNRRHIHRFNFFLAMFQRPWHISFLFRRPWHISMFPRPWHISFWQCFRDLGTFLFGNVSETLA